MLQKILNLLKEKAANLDDKAKNTKYNDIRIALVNKKTAYLEVINLISARIKECENKEKLGNPYACFSKNQRPHPMDFDTREEYEERIDNYLKWESDYASLKDNQSFQDYLNEASKMYWAPATAETKPIMLEDSDRIELKTVQSIQLLSNYETHLKENYKIEIPEEAIFKFLEQ